MSPTFQIVVCLHKQFTIAACLHQSKNAYPATRTIENVTGRFLQKDFRFREWRPERHRFTTSQHRCRTLSNQFAGGRSTRRVCRLELLLQKPANLAINRRVRMDTQYLWARLSVDSRQETVLRW
jgi:hypothetical protein